MASWNPDVLDEIAGGDFFVSPFREDGATYGTATRVWPLVVDGTVYVRAAHGPESRWYQAAIAQRAGRIRVGSGNYDVTFEPAGEVDADAIDAAYEAKYPGDMSSVRTMQGEGPTAATVRILPA